MSYSFATLPGSDVHGTSQEKMLKWTAISSSRGSSQPSDRTWVSCIGRRVLCRWATGKPFLCIRVSPQVGENGSYLLKVLKYLKIQVYKTQNSDFPGGSVTTEPGDMVRSWVWEDATCRRALKPVRQTPEPACSRARGHSKGGHHPEEPTQDNRSMGSSEEPAQPEINNK